MTTVGLAPLALLVSSRFWSREVGCQSRLVLQLLFRLSAVFTHPAHAQCLLSSCRGRSGVPARSVWRSWCRVLVWKASPPQSPGGARLPCLPQSWPAASLPAHSVESPPTHSVSAPAAVNSPSGMTLRHPDWFLPEPSSEFRDEIAEICPCSAPGSSWGSWRTLQCSRVLLGVLGPRRLRQKRG